MVAVRASTYKAEVRLERKKRYEFAKLKANYLHCIVLSTQNQLLANSPMFRIQMQSKSTQYW